MKKTILTISVCGVLILELTGCNNANKTDTEDNNDIHTFKATILECNQKNMIVKPDETEDEYKSSDRFIIQYTDGFMCRVDTKVQITYEGFIDESYPAQVGTTNIEIIK